MRGRHLALAWLTLSFVALPSAADQVEGTRSYDLAERSHDIQITMDRGHARLVVRRTVFNGSEAFDQAVFNLELPEGAVATGLRTLGRLGGSPHWFKGDLLEAETAAARYQELTGIGGYYPKDPALLSWRSLGHLALQVFPCEPGRAKTVEYTLLMPTRYEGGSHRLDLPPLGTDDLAAKATIRPARPNDRVSVDGKAIDPNRRVTLNRAREILLDPVQPPRIDGALAAHGIGPVQALNRWHFELAPRLSQVPKGAWVVVILDTSRSMGQEKIAAAELAAKATLSHFGDARVEVLTYARAVRQRYGRFVSSPEAIQDLTGQPRLMENGSQVDLALGLADQLLSQVPPGAPKRVLLLSDTQARSTLAVEDLGRRLKRSRALLHIGDIRSASPDLERHDEHPWAPVARTTGGLVWSAAAKTDMRDDFAQRVYEEWARPIRLDHVEVRAPGVPAESLSVPLSLDEGEGTTELRFSSTLVPWVELRAELWSAPVRHVLRPSAAEAKRWAALAFGSPEFEVLNDQEILALARHGGAVSPMTSYLAVEPGVRPSTEGLDWGRGEGIGLGSLGTVGHGSGTGGGGLGISFDAEGWLTARIGSAWNACGGAPKGAAVALETTWREIVDVTGVELSSPNLTKEECLQEAVWNLDLDEMFEQWARRSFEIRV